MPAPHRSASSLHWVVRLARAAGWPRAETIFLSADADMVGAWAIVVTTCGISDDQLVAEVSRIHDNKVIEATDATDAANTPDNVRRPRILVVDDDPVIAQLLSMVLERGGYEVLRAAQGIQALELAALGLAGDAIILDIGLPDIDGRAVLSHLRESRYSEHLPVIVLTGNDDPSIEATMRSSGADDFLRKPVDPSIVLARVRAIVPTSA